MGRAIYSFAKCDPRATLPVFKTKGAVGADISSLEEVGLKPGEVTPVRTGLIAIVPSVYNTYWEVCLRSGFGIKHHGVYLANGVGIIDPDYCGPEDEIKVLLYNSNKWVEYVQAGERIAQLILRDCIRPLEIKEISIDEVKEKYKNRGGLGSTGIK
jgi:dUTP pyrophosphatase